MNKTAKYWRFYLNNIQYINIGSQVKFIDTIRYYQQSLASLATSANEEEKANRNCSGIFILQNEDYSSAFNTLSNKEKNFVLDFSSDGKGVIPYQKIKSEEDLDGEPEEGFFVNIDFFSLLKNRVISDEDYENIKTFWQIMCLKKLSDLNNIYNFQDTIILCEVFQNRTKEMIKVHIQYEQMHICKLAQRMHPPMLVKGNHPLPA